MDYPTDMTPAPVVALLPAPDGEPELLRRQIDHTRAQMERTIDAIGERLSPENLIEQAKTSAKEAAAGRIRAMSNEANRKVDEVSTGLGQAVRENPLPVALIGLGLGWLWMARQNKANTYPDSRYVYRSAGNGFDDDRSRWDDTRERMAESVQAADRKAAAIKYRASEAVQGLSEAVSDAAQRAGETAAESVYQAGEAMGETAGNLQERVGETAERAQLEAERLRREAEWRSRMAMERTRRSFWETMESNPLVVGAVAAAVGTAIGASIPATPYENQLLGETRDRLLDEAKVRAQDAVGRVQAVVEDTQRAAMAEAKDSAQRHQLSIDELAATNPVN